MDSGKLIPSNGHANGGNHQALENYFSSGSYAAIPQEPGLLDYWRILAKRKILVLTTFGLILFLSALTTFRATKLYQSVSRVAVYRESAQVLDFKDGMAPIDSDDWDYTVAIETQVRIMESDSLALQVAKDLGWDKVYATVASAETALPPAAPPLTPNQEADLIGMGRGGLQIQSVPNTRMIELRYSSPDPQTAAKVLNTFMEEYIQQSIRAKYESTVQATEWLNKQLADLRLKVEVSQQKLVQYQKQNDILGLDEKQNILPTKLDDLNKALTEATAERIQREATYKLTGNTSAELLAQADPNTLIEQLRAREADLKTQYAQLSTQFGPAYPKVAELANELTQVQSSIQQETKRMTGRLENQYRSSAQREQMLQAALENKKQEANKLNERAIQYSLLKRDLDTNQQLYDNLLQRMKEASVSAALKSSNIRIADMARVPTSPSSPNVPRDLMLGFLGAVVAAIVLGLLVEMLDTTVRTPGQVQVVSALPSLGIVPLGRDMPRRLLGGDSNGERRFELISHSHPRSEIAESYRALRTSILLSSLGAPPRVILVTSALPQEGKTTTSVNCAIVLAQQGGRVLLVDADLRRPSVHESLGISSGAGLSTLLAGQSRAEDVIVRSPQLPSLHVLPAGPPPPQPAELLASDLMKQLLEGWRQQFDHIVLDTPPALSVTDPVALSVMADSVILVIRSGSPRREALRRTRDLLLRVNAKVTGVVVNAVDLRAPDLHHYYYSGASYGQKYYKYYDDSMTAKRQ